MRDDTSPQCDRLSRCAWCYRFLALQQTSRLSRKRCSRLLLKDKSGYLAQVAELARDIAPVHVPTSIRFSDHARTACTVSSIVLCTSVCPPA